MPLNDLRFGLRSLRNSPVFALTSILVLALAIGSNTLIFSLINALLLRPLPVKNPENLVRVTEVHPTGFVTWDFADSFCSNAPRDPDFSEILCQGQADLALIGGSSTERVRVHLVSPNFFDSLGIHPHLGRVLTPADRDPEAVLSYAFWQRRFHSDPSVLGRTVTLAGRAFTIAGVTPESFNGLSADTTPDLRVPAATKEFLLHDQPLYSQFFARLSPHTTLERADAAVDKALHASLDEANEKLFPSAAGSAPPLPSRLHLESVERGVSSLRAQFSSSLELLMAGVVLLLAMASVNVAGLLLARSTARSHEFEIRRALGATSSRILSQLLSEGLLIAIPGALLGVLLATAAVPLFVRNLPAIRDRGAVQQTIAIHVPLDLRVLAFTALIAAATAVLFALSPALRLARPASRTASARSRSRNLIVAAQIALCTIILIGAALLVTTLQRMRTMNPGFDATRIVTFTIDPGIRNYKPDDARALSRRLHDAVRSLPGVECTAIATRAVMRGTGIKSTLQAAGTRVTPSDFLNSSRNDVTPDYFDTMGIRLLAGRNFDTADATRKTPRLAIVNQSFARHFFPARDPIGRRFGFAAKDGTARPDAEVIGVVSDAKYRSLREPIPPTVYYPADGFESLFILHVRTREHPEAIIGPVRESLSALDREMPILEAQTLASEVENSLWQERLLAWISALFGGAAALLASIGLYGTLDDSIRSRTREIGIRMAIGAQSRQIASALTRDLGWFIVAGLCVGVLGYAAAASWIRRVLFQVESWELAAIAPVFALLIFVAIVSIAPPLRRALRISPSVALRRD